MHRFWPPEGAPFPCDQRSLANCDFLCDEKLGGRFGYFTRPQLGPSFCPEICALTGFGERSLQPFEVLSDPKVLFNTQKRPLIAVNGH